MLISVESSNERYTFSAAADVTVASHPAPSVTSMSKGSQAPFLTISSSATQVQSMSATKSERSAKKCTNPSGVNDWCTRSSSRSPRTVSA